MPNTQQVSLMGEASGRFFFCIHWQEKPGTSSLIASALSLTCDSLPLMHASHQWSCRETLHPAARRGLTGVMGSPRSSAQVLLLCILSMRQAEIDAPSLIIFICVAVIGELVTLLCPRRNVVLPLQLCGLQARVHLAISPANVHRWWKMKLTVVLHNISVSRESHCVVLVLIFDQKRREKFLKTML